MHKLLLVACALLVGCAYQIEEGAYDIPPYGDLDSCVSVDLVRHADIHTRSLFSYKKEDGDSWSSYGAELVAGQHFKGDCEDYALSAADYLTAKGVHRRHLAIATLRAGSNPFKSMDHAVLVVTSCDGQRVIDNHNMAALPISEYSEYNWHSIRRLDSDSWKKIVIKRDK